MPSTQVALMKVALKKTPTERRASPVKLNTGRVTTLRNENEEMKEENEFE